MHAQQACSIAPNDHAMGSSAVGPAQDVGAGRRTRPSRSRRYSFKAHFA
jgi:hypothetical protein